MTDLVNNFALPWYIWLILGMILAGLVFNNGFRRNADELLAKMMGMKPKKQPKDNGDE